MRGPEAFLEFAHFHRPAHFRGVELLTARYRDFAFAPHVHESHGIALLEDGAERFRCRGREQVATPGTLTLVNPDEVHDGSRAVDAGWGFRVFYLPPGLLEAFAATTGARSGGTLSFPETLVEDPALAASLRRLHRSMAGGAELLEQESRWCEALGLLLERHVRGLQSGLTAPGARPAVEQARDLLRARVEENLGLSELAEAVGLSPWHLNRLFREQVGLPPHAFRLQVRLARARGLLRAAMPIAEVAATLGFADQAHLTRLFKRAFGISPAAYRRAA